MAASATWCTKRFLICFLLRSLHFVPGMCFHLFWFSIPSGFSDMISPPSAPRSVHCPSLISFMILSLFLSTFPNHSPLPELSSPLSSRFIKATLIAHFTLHSNRLLCTKVFICLNAGILYGALISPPQHWSPYSCESFWCKSRRENNFQAVRVVDRSISVFMFHSRIGPASTETGSVLHFKTFAPTSPLVSAYKFVLLLCLNDVDFASHFWIDFLYPRITVHRLSRCSHFSLSHWFV